MATFDAIFQAAAQRKGGIAALEAQLPKAATARTLKGRSDDRYLSQMTACVFPSGFVWRVIESKWPHFEEVFNGFDVTSCVMQSDDVVKALARDARIVRKRTRIESVPRFPAAR